jgi:hypothetical protein
MSHNIPRPPRLFIVPALLLGLCLGLLGGLWAGWMQWPVRWYDTDPSDLRLAHQVAYVTMVADSYALTEDRQVATQRLYELMDDDTSWEQVANLVMRVAVAREEAGDAASAQRIRQVFEASALPSPYLAEWHLTPPDRGMEVTVGLAALGLLALLSIIALLRMATAPWPPSGLTAEVQVQEPDWLDGLEGQAPVPQSTEPQSPASVTPAAGWPVAGASAAGWPAADPAGTRPSEAVVPVAPQFPVAEPFDDDDEWEDAFEEEDDLLDDDDLVSPPALKAFDSPANVEGPQDDQSPLGVYEAEYVRGESRFDCSFNVEDSDGSFLGECGVGLADLGESEGSESGAAEAFEIWLFDKTDIRTVSTVLVSERAYRDQALRDQLNAKGDVVVAQPGLVITLETLTLRMEATVDGYAYVVGGARPNRYFAKLNVALRTWPAEG